MRHARTVFPERFEVAVLHDELLPVLFQKEAHFGDRGCIRQQKRVVDDRVEVEDFF